MSNESSDFEEQSIVPILGLRAGSQAEKSTGKGVVNYYFPVEVVVVGSFSQDEHAVLEARIWDSLGDALDRTA